MQWSGVELGRDVTIKYFSSLFFDIFLQIRLGYQLFSVVSAIVQCPCNVTIKHHYRKKKTELSFLMISYCFSQKV